MYFDPLYLLFALPGLIIGLWAQIKLMSAYGKYGQVPTESGLSGAGAAREILDRAGLTEVAVAEVPGHLTDHYDPSRKALFLSSNNFHGRTVAAVGVAAHEAGHALQHQAAYAPLKLRMALVPVTQFASYAWAGILMLGMILGGPFFSKFIGLAIAIFAVMTVFHLVTLPVEFDASQRAKELLFRFGVVHAEERHGVSQVLNAAALTYVAALVVVVTELLYFLTRARSSRN